MSLKPKMVLTTFFDDSEVIRALDAATRRNLSRFGALTRRDARRSLRPARMIRFSEMEPEKRANFRLAQKIAKREGSPAPKRGRISAKKGQPPKLQRKNSPLKRLLFYSYNKQTQSVVVGPTRFGTKSAGEIEQNNPFVRPAANAQLPALMSSWKDSLR